MNKLQWRTTWFSDYCSVQVHSVALYTHVQTPVLQQSHYAHVKLVWLWALVSMRRSHNLPQPLRLRLTDITLIPVASWKCVDTVSYVVVQPQIPCLIR